jgi:hypothetical protein
MPFARPPVRVGTFILAFAGVCALALAVPRTTVTTLYVNDLLIFLDGAHRIVSGQVPNRDFHTALGPLVSYIPGAGYWLFGTLGGALPGGMALALVVLAPVIAHILATRLRPVIALPFGAFLIAMLAAPVNLGEGLGALSFAMFYNRLGWAALTTLLVMVLRPLSRRAPQPALDALCAAALTLTMLYTKASYGAVALGFLVFMLFDARQRVWAAMAIVVTLVTGLIVEAFWRSTFAHVADLILASRVSGARPLADLIEVGLRHLPDFAFFSMLAGFALWRTRSLRDALFYGFCAGAGVLVANQNAQPWGIISLHAGAAVAAELLLRSDAHRTSVAASSGNPRFSAGAPLLFLAIILPTLIHCLVALGLHTALALGRAGESFGDESAGLAKLERVRLVRLWSPGEHGLSHAYVESLRDGARALTGLEPEPTRVSVLDFANGLSAGLGLPPPRGDSAWLHWGRNVDGAHHIPPEELFADVDIMMLPKWGVNHAPLLALYGPYVQQAFRPIRETAGWTVYRRPALVAAQ